MPSLFAGLNNAAQTLRAFERAIGVTQNNVNNASTPGYARQVQPLEALPFEPGSGLLGGVRAGELQSARDVYAEQAVRDQAQTSSSYSQQAASLASIEGMFDLTGDAGIAASWRRLLSSFSSWSIAPNSAVERQAVVDSANALALSFRGVAGRADRARAAADRDLETALEEIRGISESIRQYNVDRRRSSKPDAGLDAQLHANLEKLAGLVNVSVLYQEDGTVTVLAGGQVPLVIGDGAEELKLSFDPAPAAAYPGALPTAKILDSEGRDVTALLDQGKTGGLLAFRNGTLGNLLGDETQEGELNRLASHVADRVNALLTSGYVSSGPPPVSGSPLFAYDTVHSTNTARSLTLAPGASSGSLAAIDPGPPQASNGIALRLAALDRSSDPADNIDGLPPAEFFGNLAAGFGRQLARAKSARETGEQQLAQAKSLRGELSGVSLDEEAVRLVEYQRSYQAAARLVSVIDDLMQTVIQMLR